jgi:hypothetical protein
MHYGSISLGSAGSKTPDASHPHELESFHGLVATEFPLPCYIVVLINTSSLFWILLSLLNKEASKLRFHALIDYSPVHQVVTLRARCIYIHI